MVFFFFWGYYRGRCMCGIWGGKKIVVTSEKVHDVKMVGNDVKKLETPVKRLPVKRLPARLAGLLTADGRDRWRPWRKMQ